MVEPEAASCLESVQNVGVLNSDDPAGDTKVSVLQFYSSSSVEICFTGANKSFKLTFP